MKNRIGIAYGFGRESRILLNRLKKLNPLLIICIGEKNDENRLDLLDSEIKILQEKYRVKILHIKGVSSTHGFKEDWDFLEDKNGKITITRYTNTILDYFFTKKKPFDVLYVGRRRKDFETRKMFAEDEAKRLPKRIRVSGVKFPLWDEN